MGRPLSKIQLWIIRMYLASLVLYVVYSIRWLHCKAWLHVCYRSSSSVKAQPKLAKLQFQWNKSQPKLATNKSQTSWRLEDVLQRFNFLQETYFYNWFLLADNLQQILLAKEVETAKKRRRAQKQVMKEMRPTWRQAAHRGSIILRNNSFFPLPEEAT